MKKFLIAMLLSLLTTLTMAKEIDITKSKGTEQSEVHSLTPAVGHMQIPQGAEIKVVFTVALNPKSIQKNEITLKDITQTKKRSIGGDVTYNAEEKSIIFTPAQSLQEGYYEITIKSLRTIGEEKDAHIGGIQYRFFVTEQEIVNGYVLPPTPDPTLNNATLLGVDSNDNGIRDDVERKIVIKYVKPIEIELMLSYAKIDQEIMASLESDVLVLERKGSRVSDCEMYLLKQGIDIKNSVSDSENFTYNTKSRAKKYMNYNKALSGGVYGSSPSDWNAEACNFDVEQMLSDRK